MYNPKKIIMSCKSKLSTRSIIIFEKILMNLGVNVPPTVKVVWRRDLGLLSCRLEKPGIEPATPGSQGE